MAVVGSLGYLAEERDEGIHDLTYQDSPVSGSRPSSLGGLNTDSARPAKESK